MEKQRKPLFLNLVSKRVFGSGVLFYELADNVWCSVACDPQLRWRLLFANEDWILGFDLGFPKAKFLSNSRCLAQLKSGWDWEIISWGGSVLWTVQMGYPPKRGQKTEIPATDFGSCRSISGGWRQSMVSFFSSLFSSSEAGFFILILKLELRIMNWR